MKQVTYKEIIVIDGSEYYVSTHEYTDVIDQLIRDSIISDNNQDIINHIVDDITNDI